MYLNDYGPVIAIGRPGEWAPPLGAARKYVTDDWQGEVLDLINKCQLIVVILGKTNGLAWEIQQLIRLGVLKKLILVIPPVNPYRITATLGGIPVYLAKGIAAVKQYALRQNRVCHVYGNE
jgi:hypothetical protein